MYEFIQFISGYPVDINEIHASLEAIISDPSPPPTHSIGYLTSSDRDVWTQAREELLSNPDNERALAAIDSSLIILCLDDKELEEDPTVVTSTFLHNRGFNRYYIYNIYVCVHIIIYILLYMYI